MALNLANAPVSWGVDYADDPRNPPWPEVMDQIGEAGYRYTELGPYGYYPTDPSILKDEFAGRRLQVVAGFLFQPLNIHGTADKVLEAAIQTIDLLSEIGGKYLVVIDHICEPRVSTAGRSDLAERLDSTRFAAMITLIGRISEYARKKDVLPVVHQHAGCFIEFEDEIEGILDAIPDSELGLCIDTGHMAYAGIDPVAFYRRHAARVKYFHFKDINPAVHHRILADGVPFLEAVSQNVFCPLGQGVVDFRALRLALEETGFSGFATIEQDIDSTASFQPLEDAKRSLAFLRTAGF